MKPSHYSTPRLMRDGTWTAGNVSHTPQPWRLADLAIAAVAVAVVAFITLGVI